MRIGFDAKRAFKNFTGLGNYSRSVISIMSSFYPQNEYILYTPPHKKSFNYNISNTIEKQPKGLMRFFHSFWRSFGISSQIKNSNIDIYHGLSHELPRGIKKSGAKTVVTMHDLIVLRYPHLYKPIDRAIYIRKYKRACKDADLIIAISIQTKKDLINFLDVDESKIRLVYQGCDPQFCDLKTEAEKLSIKEKYNLPDKYILSVGTIEPRKKLNTIVQALPLLCADTHLVVVGKPTEYMKTVENEITKLNLAHRVHFFHKLPFCDLPAFYQLADVFVYPSVFEGFGIPILEAMNSKTPVVAAQSSSLPEVGGNAAMYFDSDDYKTLSEHINAIRNNAEIRNEMVAKGLVQAKNFTDDKIALQLFGVYAELFADNCQ